MHQVVAGDEEAAAASRPAHVVGGLPVGLHAVGVLLRVRRLHDAVRRLEAADAQRLGEEAHATILAPAVPSLLARQSVLFERGPSNTMNVHIQHECEVSTGGRAA